MSQFLTGREDVCREPSVQAVERDGPYSSYGLEMFYLHLKQAGKRLVVRSKGETTSRFNELFDIALYRVKPLTGRLYSVDSRYNQHFNIPLYRAKPSSGRLYSVPLKSTLRYPAVPSETIDGETVLSPATINTSISRCTERNRRRGDCTQSRYSQHFDIPLYRAKPFMGRLYSAPLQSTLRYPAVPGETIDGETVLSPSRFNELFDIALYRVKPLTGRLYSVDSRYNQHFNIPLYRAKPSAGRLYSVPLQSTLRYPAVPSETIDGETVLSPATINTSISRCTERNRRRGDCTQSRYSQHFDIPLYRAKPFMGRLYSAPLQSTLRYPAVPGETIHGETVLSPVTFNTSIFRCTKRNH
ncbi:hypothetical protein RRG08_031590 [Elysia crispata]|uniref:Uncharacterized protein n=1 Tax=Elysia crispata TaxID=231223 RepID=A0AAE1B2D7_9GAST|nr:hypothetical protein RRG08_031590 [Elysia crispata]